MDSIYDIALSHIADIFSTDKLYTLSLDMWSKIYHHSGQSHLYTEYERKITPLKEPYGYGLFDYYIVPNEYCYSAKEIGYKWYSGLAEICHFDKNIDNVTNYSKLGELSYYENSQDENQRYNYPRYKLIYRLYSFTSDLGSHVTEGNMTQERTIEHEETYSSDALMGLRMTQSFLLWIYQNEDYDSI